MSNIDQPDRYINPQLPSKTDTIYKSYSNFTALGNGHDSDIIYVQNPNPNDYPKQADYARFPVMVNCDQCNTLNMSQIQYQHGRSSCCWCFFLLPIMCTGACCLCLNSCKDVRHRCSKCKKDVGINKSDCC